MLQLRINPSRWDLVTTVISHGGALYALLLVPLPMPLLLPGMLAICWSARHQLKVWRAADGGRLRGVDIGAEHAVLHYRDRRVTTRLPEPRLVSEWLIILRFPPQPEGPGARRSAAVADVILFPDSLDADSERRLRRYLRFEAPAGAGRVRGSGL